MEPWFVRRPGRLQRELEALDAAGFLYEVNEDIKAAGRIQITVQLPYNGNAYEILVDFPFFYPYTPFALYSDDIPDGRHKAAYRSNICFLHEVDAQWSIKDTLASILSSQVCAVIEAHLKPAENSTIEAADPNPAAFHIDYLPSQTILVPAMDVPTEHQYGYARLSYNSWQNLNVDSRGHIMTIMTDKKNVFCQIGDEFPGLLEFEIKAKPNGKPSRSQFDIRWVRLNAPPSGVGINILDEAISKWPELGRPMFKSGPDIVALIFPDDGEESWVFVRRVKEKVGRNKQRIAYHNIRADFISRKDIGARVPKLAPLAGKKVTIIGCGAIGSAIAMQFGRIGLGHLVLVDHDFLQTSNLPRWVAGANASGDYKSSYLHVAISQANPFLKVSSHVYQLGGPVRLSSEDEGEVLADIFDDTDLIIDATASYSASHLISDLAKELNIPCIYGSGTSGSYGGVVARFMPNAEDFCWSCLQAGLLNKDIQNPPADGGGDVRVRGCFHPAFTGTGFDMDHVALMAVRMAVATLCRGRKIGYPELDWNVGVLSLWDKDREMPVGPEWKTANYVKHPKCVKSHN